MATPSSPFSFSSSALAAIQTAFDSGNAAAAYLAINNGMSTSGLIDPAIDPAVAVFLAGAYRTNIDSGAFATYIRQYTSSQYLIRYGTALNPQLIQTASNQIGMAIANDILTNGGVLPSLQKIAQFDAGRIASTIFFNEYVPWAGTVLFADLGDDSFFKNWALTTNSVQNPSGIGYRTDLGTYDLISIAEATIENKTIFGSVSTLFTGLSTYITTSGLGSVAIPDAETATQNFFASSYGTGVETIRPDLAIFSDGYGLTSSGLQYQAGTLTAESINVLPTTQVFVGGPGDDTVTAATIAGFGGTPFSARIVDGGLGDNTLNENTPLNLTITLEKVTRTDTSSIYAYAPRWRADITADDPRFNDYAYNFGHIRLSVGDDTLVFGPNISPSDLIGSNGLQQLKSIEGGSGLTTIDLSSFQHSSIKHLVDGNSVTFGGVSITKDKLDTTNTYLVGLDTLIGTDLGDYISGTTDFKSLNLGNGDNYVSDVSGVALSGQTGPTAHAVRINLGSGSSTVEGSIAAGSEIYAEAGHTDDHIEISSDTRLHGLNPTDLITWAGVKLTGGTHNTQSDDPWAYSLGGLFRYGINQVGDLVIETPSSMALALGGSGVDPATYIAGYINGDAGGNANATAHIYTLDVTTGAYLVCKTPSLPGTVMSSLEAVFGNISKAWSGTSYWAGVDPLVLDLGGSGIATSPLEKDSTQRFDINGDGFANPTGWVGASQGLLVHLDGGATQVTGARQLFGNQVVSGFTQLAQYDTNHDGVIDANDAGWSSLRIWQDLNGDQQETPDELLTMDQAGIVSISLSTTPYSGPLQQGNQIIETATFTRTDGTTSTIADVALATDNYNSTYLGQTSTSAAAAALPDLMGHGTLISLREAMTADEVDGGPGPLETAVQQALTAMLPGQSIDTWRQEMLPVLAAWVAVMPDPKPTAPRWWTQTNDSQGNAIQGAPSNRPDVYIVVSGDGANRTAVDDLEYKLDTVTTTTTDPTTGLPVTITTTYGDWVFGSGRAVTDADGNVIAHPTLKQAAATPLQPGESWTVIHAGTEMDFLERYLGDDLPFGQYTDNHAGVFANLTSALNAVVNVLDIVAARFAVQSPTLAPYFGSLQYDPTTDLITAATSTGLVPTYQAIFATCPTDEADATAYLQNWQSVLYSVEESYSRGVGLTITQNFVVGNIVAGWESATSCPLTLLQAA